MNNSIVKGTTVTYDYTLTDTDGEPFDLAGCTVDFVATNQYGATAITSQLVVDIFGAATTENGLTLDTGATGKIVQVLTTAVTSGLTEGRLQWRITLTDSTGAVSYPLAGAWVVVSNARTPVTFMPTGPSRRDLRRRIARNIGDYKMLEATAASAGTDIVDVLNISSASEDLSGCQVIVTSGANVGHVARIQYVNESLNKAILNPPASSNFAINDTADVVMKRGRGWDVAEYHQAINDAINDAYPYALAEIMAPVSDFDVDSGVIYVPPELLEVYAVEWQDSNGNWHPIPKAQRTAGWGWKVDIANGTIVITESPRYLADNRPVRLYGYGRHPELRAESDRTDVNPEWLVSRASYYLCRSGIDRDPQRGSLILLFEREAAALRPRLRTLRKGATARVRPT